MLGLLQPVIAAAQTPSDFNVNSIADKVDATPGDGICSTGATIDGHTAECTLRAAIDEVNALSAANPTRMYIVSVMPGTYSLTASETCVYHDAGNPNGNSTTTTVLCVSGNMTLNGADQATTIVDHALIDRDFFVSAGYTVSINNMTIQNGAQYGGTFDGAGGGINNQGNLTLSNDLFFRNSSQTGGAGVYNGGTMVVEGCTFLANSGPGIEANYSTISIDNSYFTQNSAGNGAAISVYVATLNMSNSTASANLVGQNGVIASYNSVTTITNSTISNNTIGNAGALVSSGNGSSLTLNGVTISGNVAGNIIGGLFAASATMSNTILAGNTGSTNGNVGTASYDCAVDTMTDLGHNLVQVPEPQDCALNSSTLVGVDAKLGAVALDGGLVPTQGPLPGSPAIGAGSPATPGSNAAGACTAIDERGFVRGRSGACTIGAVEQLGGLEINNVSPKVGSPGGTARIVVHGSGFVPGSTLALSGGGQSIPILQTTVAADTFSITALLDLKTAVLGSYDVVVTTPASASTTLPGSYTVEKATAPLLYSYLYGPGVARAGRPDFYSVVYGNSGNADAYLVPITLSIPGGFAGLISSPVLVPPVASGQVIQDWTSVPIQVSPYSTTAFSNVPLIIPVLPAGSSGVIQFSITAPAGTPEDTPYSLDASLGSPYSTALNGAADPAILADFSAGAQSYAQTNLGVTLTPSELAAMSSYASAQLAQEAALGGQALLESAGGSPVLFSNSQLLIDIATYGASLATPASGPAISNRKSLRALSVHANITPAPSNPVSNSCSGGTVTPGPSCIPIAITVPTPISVSFTAADCRDLPDHYVSPNGTLCLVLSNLLPVSSPGALSGSVDPNAKDGPLGIGSAHFTLADVPFHYQVEFENTPTATAPAQTVSVTDPLDTTKYDLSTFELGPISFGPYVLSPPPGLSSFASALDLRPTENVIVTVRASLNASTGVATWNFTSLDPSTMQLVTDPTAGFLPADTNPPAGIGHVTFSVQPLASVASGATICNTASIVFDTNAAIATAPFCNSKDTTAPVSAVKTLSATETTPTFTVSWSGTDAGVGVATYTIYVSVDGGAFTAWQTATANLSASYTGSFGHTYGFYSIAADLLGNTEAAKTAAEATTTISTGLPLISGVSPGYGAIAAVIELTGNFGASQGAGYVQVNGAKSQVLSWSNSAITIRVPYNGTPGAGSVVVTADGQRSNPIPFTLSGFPTVTNVSVSGGTPGAPVTITGTNLLDNQAKASVTFNGTPATITSDTATGIQVTVPAAATSGELIVEVNNVAIYALQNFAVTPALPNIAGISPNYGAIAADITITGNFDPAQGSGYVTVGGGVSQVTSWSNSKITIRAPYSGTTGPVIVRQDGKTSNGVPFTLYPSPKITSVSASSGAPGTIVTITGTNLLDGGSKASVTFNGTPAAITSDTATSIQVTVPAGATSGRVILQVNNVSLYALQDFVVE